MKTKPIQMYVYPAFKTKLKMLAIEKNKNIISLTKELSSDDFDKMKDSFNNKWKKNGKTIFFQQ